MKTYNVKIPVWETIEIVVKAKSKQDALNKAIEQAVEEQPKVYWQVDDEREMTAEKMK